MKNYSDKILKVVNNGKLEAGGTGEKFAYVVNFLGTNGVDFTNKGSIIISEGSKGCAIGIAVTNENGSILNTGKIFINSNSKVLSNGVSGDKVNRVTFDNTGTIIITDKTAEELKNINISDLISGISYDNLKNIGMITGKDGVAVDYESDIVLSGEISASDINQAGKEANRVVLGKNEITLKGSSEITKIDTINIVKKAVKVKNGENNEGLTLDIKSLNIDAKGSLALTENSKLEIKNGTINKNGENKNGLTLSKDSFLRLENVNANTNIVGLDNKNITNKGTVEAKNTTINGNIMVEKFNVIGGTKEEVNTTTINGEIAVEKITVGGTSKSKSNIAGDKVVKDKLVLSSNSKFTNTTGSTLTINKNGQVFLGIDKDGNNAFKNTTSGSVTVKGDNNGKTTDLVLETGNLSGDNIKIGFGEKVTFDGIDRVTVGTDSKIYVVDKNKAELNGTNKDVIVSYNTKLYEDNTVLNNVNNAAKVVSNLFSNDVAERKVQLDKIYSSNIYSETVKAAYDIVKMNEEAVLSLARKSEVGKWTAEGKALYSKDEYDRKGTVGEYSSEIESTGLMAAFGYGLNETTTAGVAFSGVKQDVDTDGGSADADLFYLGLYGNKVYGNYDFTAGVGYQFGEYEADNNILGTTGDKYDSKALSGYVQGRYTADLEDGLSLQPRVRLGYTYVEQDDARDSYFGVSDAEISTFDAEFGLDTVKSVQLEKSKVDVKFGVSYVRTMGDTDDEFTGRFYGATASEGFNVLGAELAENVVKFNLGAEVTNENGFFYNGGFTYEFGSNDTDAYGVNVGVGYKF